jgi:hypothetical protein
VADRCLVVASGNLTIIHLDKSKTLNSAMLRE